MQTRHKCIRKATTTATNEHQAVAELDEQLKLSESVMSVVFCSSQYNVKAFETHISELAKGAPVIGCTSAGEIGFEGYMKDGATGFSFDSADFAVAVETIEDLQNFSVEHAENIASQLKFKMEKQGFPHPYQNCFALLLVDGLSLAEEHLVFKLQNALGDIPIVGGSAGDNLEFAATYVLSKGEFKKDSAVLAIVHSNRPWESFKEEHNLPTDKKVLVTEAIPERRIVVKLNCEPAAEELARLVGVENSSGLTPSILGQNPLMLKLSGNWYNRSVIQVNEDKSITLHCAIQEGMVLSLGKPHALVGGLKERLEAIEKRIGKIQLTIACDCIMRRLELESKNLIPEASEILKQHNAIGLSTFGEQYGAIHVNQTLTGIAIA